mgnify:CR=1 FL=1
MNKHIDELVKEWLANPESVSQQELEDNRDAAYVAYVAAVAGGGVDAVLMAAAVYTNAANVAYVAANRVKRYEELKEQGE